MLTISLISTRAENPCSQRLVVGMGTETKITFWQKCWYSGMMRAETQNSAVG